MKRVAASIFKTYKKATYIFEDLQHFEVEPTDYTNPGIEYYALKLALQARMANVRLVDHFNSSNTCPKCGYVNPNNRNKQTSTFTCLSCNFKTNDDVAAAMNIRSRGMIAEEDYLLNAYNSFGAKFKLEHLKPLKIHKVSNPMGTISWVKDEIQQGRMLLFEDNRYVSTCKQEVHGLFLEFEDRIIPLACRMVDNYESLEIDHLFTANCKQWLQRIAQQFSNNYNDFIRQEVDDIDYFFDTKESKSEIKKGDIILLDGPKSGSRNSKNPIEFDEKKREQTFRVLWGIRNLITNVASR